MTRETKAAEDRHIGFRWLRWAARLKDERSAEAVFRAVAAQLALRLGPGPSRHIRAHLPLGLREVWDEEARSGRQESVDRGELVERVRGRLGLRSGEDAERLVSLVFAWLRHLAPEERDDLSAALPADLRELWERARLEAPSWPLLHVPLRGPGGRLLHARFRTPEGSFEADVFDLPARRSLWWHGETPYRVRRVEQGDRPTVELARDLAVESACTGDLPTGYTLTARQRPGDGMWVAEVRDAGGHTVAWWDDEDCLAAAEEAHAIARRSLERERVYHPEREASP